MANFQTHITYAAAGSGLLSVLCLQIGLVDQREALNLAFLGTVGGILPDIDLQRSYPSRILFAILGIFCAFLMVFSLENSLSILELWLTGLGTFLLVRFPIWQIFHYYTVHRGMIHSVCAAFFASFVTAIVSYYTLGANDLVAWLNAFFLFMGFIIHLLLDECYSVDFSNRRIKRSFGSALKLIDSKKPTLSVFFIVITVGMWALTPPVGRFWGILGSPSTYQIILSRFWY